MYLKEKIALTVAGILFVLIFAYAGFGHHLMAFGQPPIRLMLEGHEVARMAGFNYYPSTREVHVDTIEMLYDCKEGTIFIDRFEP